MLYPIPTGKTGILGTFAATLFALLNPFGMLPVFIGYTAGRSTSVQRWLALFISMTVLGLMLLFLFAGTALLNFFGITIDAFRVAGGILLLLIESVPSPRPDDQGARPRSRNGSRRAVRSRVGLWPDRCSVRHAPSGRTGVIANLILYAGEAWERKSAKLASGLVAVTVGVSLFTLVILLSAEFLRRLLGDVGLSIATRILGLLVASIGVQFVIAGLTNVIVNSIVPAVLPQLHG